MFLRGSEWRRWDIHVHTPGTALNDQFGSWDEYLAAIEANRGVKVVGVTDYMMITNYSRLKAYKEQGRISNIELLVPNIEFRMAPPSDKATAINIHLLVSPNDPKHEEEITNALGRLTWRYGKGNYSCLPDQLENLGRAFNPTVVSERDALAAGVLQFKVDFTTFRNWLEGEPWLNQNSLVAVSAGEDGLSGFQRDGAWGGYREEITRFSRVLFSGRPGEREFWIGRRSAEDRETALRLGGFKPCLHGSDAHSLAKLFKPDQDRFCWIKADPTFEGLRQVLYEPEDRVHIGPTPPIYHDEARVIRNVAIANSSGWFEDVEIPLNSGLVSIIGQKGSGKSALAECIAYAAGDRATDEQGSFLKRAGSHLKDMTVELVWADSSSFKVRLGDSQPEEKRVRYLSQKFVERLCADDHVGEDLIREIEAVIFSYIDPTDTLNASSFDELRAIRTESIEEEGNGIRDEVMRLIREECALRNNASKLPEKKARIKALTEERAGLAKQLPQATSAEEARVQTGLQIKRGALAALQQEVAAEKQKLQKIADVRTRVTSFKSQMGRFYADIQSALTEIGIPTDERAIFHPAFLADTEPSLARRETAIRRAIAQREGAAENPAEGTLRWLLAQIESLTKIESADKAKQERVKAIQTRIAAIDTEAMRLQSEVAQIEGPDRERVTTIRQARLDAYGAFFINLQREQKTLEELYQPVAKRLASEGAYPQEQQLDFSIRWEANIGKWLERGSVLFDQRRTIPYGTMQGLTDAAHTILEPAWTCGDPGQIRSALDCFLAEFRNPKLLPRDYLRGGVSIQDVLEWLYEVDHVHLSYGLKYNGVELEKLSPGTKGIVLLILYLGMDVADTRPLIVDQPDENLDNESIYHMLTTYFKAAKARRQIILITHNPNLVVNSDSEQVIIATATRRESGLPYITYRSGSLENNAPPDQGIRQQVCRILEGGSDAFRKRERRYDLR